MNKDLKILIAEDDILNMKLFRDILEVKMVNTICVTEASQIFKKVLENTPVLNESIIFARPIKHLNQKSLTK